MCTRWPEPGASAASASAYGRARSGVFEASNVMVKHSNEYSPPAPGEDPHTKYRTLVQDQT